MAGLLYPRDRPFRILVGMNRAGSFLRQPIVIFLGSVLLLVSAGMAAARTQGGPPWLQNSEECVTTTDAGTDVAVAEECETEEVGNDGAGDNVLEDPEGVRADVEAYFGEYADCGAAFIGDYDLADESTLIAFDDLVTRLEDGQTSHMVNSVRVLLDNCTTHPNDGLMNALYHHGLNWLRHHDHEQWLQEKFADRWPDGKPGNGNGGDHGNPHELHGNPHTTSPGAGHGNGYGHSS